MSLTKMIRLLIQKIKKKNQRQLVQKKKWIQIKILMKNNVKKNKKL